LTRINLVPPQYIDRTLRTLSRATLYSEIQRASAVAHM
jgi:hypothetical protein